MGSGEQGKERTPRACVRTIYLSIEQDEALMRTAQARGISVSALVRQLIADMLSEQNKKQGADP